MTPKLNSPEEKRQRALYFTEKLFKQAEAKGRGFTRVHIDTVRFLLDLPRKKYTDGVPCGSGTVGLCHPADGSGGDGRRKITPRETYVADAEVAYLREKRGRHERT